MRLQRYEAMTSGGNKTHSVDWRTTNSSADWHLDVTCVWCYIVSTLLFGGFRFHRVSPVYSFTCHLSPRDRFNLVNLQTSQSVSPRLVCAGALLRVARPRFGGEVVAGQCHALLLRIAPW